MTPKSGLLGLSILSLAVIPFIFAEDEAYQWVDLSGRAVIVLVAVAVLGVLAYSSESVPLAIAAAAVALLAAAIQFFGLFGGGTPDSDGGLLAGNASAFALFGSLAMGFAGLAFALRDEQSEVS